MFSNDTFRLLFLGAGFSKLAGLPLGQELFPLVRKAVVNKYGSDNHLESDLRRYVKYLQRTEGSNLSEDEVNYEEFLGFLDVEHYLGLKGKDTWSSEGNESQLMMRAGIAKVLHDLTPSRLPTAYLQFVNRLTTTDWVFTFNYDTIVEQVLEQARIPYRLFPYRYSKIGVTMNTIDDSEKEIRLIKLHGSIDWFDRTSFDERIEVAKGSSIPYQPKHPIFGHDKIVTPEPIVDGLRPADDPLSSIFRVRNLAPLFDRGFWEFAPFILAPSNMKVFYSKPLKDFWWGIQEAGGLNLGIGIVGYSLPAYDNYAKQALYHIIRNYQNYEPDLSFDGRTKAKLRILDFDPDSVSENKTIELRYRFSDPNRTEFWYKGFNDAAVDWLLR